MNRDWMKRSACLLLAGALLLTASGCGGEKEDPDGTGDENVLNIDPNSSTVNIKAKDNLFTLGYDADYTMDPINTTSSANALVDCLVYEFAVEVDPEFNPVPNLIVDWTSDNGYSWFLTVDTSVTFHDGSHLTAADVAYSINRARRSTAYGTRLNKIWGVSAMDDETVMVTLSDTNYMFPRLLNIPVVKGEEVDGLPMGTGPYVFSEDMTQLTAYMGYRKADKMPIDVIYLHQNSNAEQTISDYSTSVIDLVINDPTGLSRLGYGTNNETRYFTTTNMQFIGMNLKSEFTCYQSYRYALNYAVDRTHIVNNVLYGSAVEAALPICPTSPLYNEQLAAQYQYNLDTCLALFNAAGVRDYDQDGMLEYQLPGGNAEIDLDFVVCSDNTDKVRAAQKIAADLESIGIGVSVRQLSWDEYATAIMSGDYDLFYGEIKLTADFNLTDMLTTNGVKNYYGIDNSDYYDYIHTYLSATEETERAQSCDYMCRFLAENAPIVPICFEKQQVLTHREVVSGIEATQYNVFYGLENWEIHTDIE